MGAGNPLKLFPWNVENKELNSWNGGRGVYFRDPNGHLLELLTRPYRGLTRRTKLSNKVIDALTREAHARR